MSNYSELLKNVAQEHIDYVIKNQSRISINKFRKDHPEELKEIQKIMDQYDIKFGEALYWIINNLTEKPTCVMNGPKCVHTVRFDGFLKGYTKYCNKCIWKSEEYRTTLENSIFEKYGVKNVQSLNSVKEKMINTNIRKYGSACPLQNKEIRKKVVNNWIQKYGVDNPQKNKEIKNKTIKTCIKKYGVEYPMQSEQIRYTREMNSIAKYGVSNHMKLDKFKKLFSEKIKNTEEYQKKFEEIKNYLLSYDLEIVHYDNAVTPITLRCKKCGSIFTVSSYTQLRIKGVNPKTACRTCYPNIGRGFSAQELEVLEFIKSYLPDVQCIRNSRAIIRPQEIDLYFPEYSVAIEYNGLWCHSSNKEYMESQHIGDMAKDENYHIDKYLRCKENGINLITIFEWMWNNEVYKNVVIQSILGAFGIKNELNNIIVNRRDNDIEILGDDKLIADAKISESELIYHGMFMCDDIIKSICKNGNIHSILIDNCLMGDVNSIPLDFNCVDNPKKWYWKYDNDFVYDTIIDDEIVNYYFDCGYSKFSI